MVNIDSLFTSRLLELSLFQGMSQADITELSGKIHFDFHRYERGKVIVRKDDLCEHLYLLVNGEISIETAATNNNYIIKEIIKAPYEFQPERMLGINQRFTFTVKALSTCQVITIHRSEFISLIHDYTVFRINAMNRLASRLQKMQDMLWHSRTMTLEERLLLFLTTHCRRPAGEKWIKVKMMQLAEELNDSRINVSLILNKWQQEEKVTLSRGMIHIPVFEALFF